MTWVLIALLVVPLVGALVVAFLRKNDTKAKFVALAFSLVELVLAVLLWTAYDPDGDRIQLAAGVDWIPAFGVRLSFGRAWIAVIGGELLASPTWGLGRIIFDAKEFLNSSVMLAALLVIGALGLVFERVVFQNIERRTVARWGMVAGSKR